MEKEEFPEIEKVRQSGHEMAVAFSSMFTAATTFFTGILIQQYSSAGVSFDIPILMLIISTFGFLYATLVYSNINGMLYRDQFNKAKQSSILGNVLSEYIGVYFLILAIPLIINEVSQDVYIRAAVCVFDIIGLLIYHFSGFSIMERHYKKYHTLFVVTIVVLEIALIVFQGAFPAFSSLNDVMFKITAAVLALFIFTLAFFARREKL